MDKDRHRTNYRPSTAADELDAIAGHFTELRDLLLGVSRRASIDDRLLHEFAVMEESLTDALRPEWEAAWEVLENASEKDLLHAEIVQERHLPRFFTRPDSGATISVAEFRLMEKRLSDERRKKLRPVATNPATKEYGE